MNNYFYYYSKCNDYNIIIGPCESTASSDPMMVRYDNSIISINTSRASESNVCMKFSRNGKTDLMMS